MGTDFTQSRLPNMRSGKAEWGSERGAEMGVSPSSVLTGDLGHVPAGLPAL